MGTMITREEVYELPFPLYKVNIKQSARTNFEAIEEWFKEYGAGKCCVYEDKVLILTEQSDISLLRIAGPTLSI